MQRIVPALMVLAPLVLGPATALAALPVEHIDLTVDASQLSEPRDGVEEIRNSLDAALDGQSPLAPGAVYADDRRVVVELLSGPVPQSDDILIRVTATIDGGQVFRSDTEMCLSCDNTNISRKAFPLLLGVLERLPGIDAVEEPELLDACPVEPMAPPAPAFDPSRRPLVFSGVALLGVGVIGLGLGGGMIIVDKRPVSGRSYSDLDFRNPGIAVATIAGAMAITGAALLAVGLKHRPKTQAKTQTQTQISAAPLLDRHTAGLALWGQF